MKYLIIGLGIYGSNLVRDLTDMGHEVVGADRSASIVDAIKDTISTAYILDSTEETALSALPLSGVDLVIVAIGENFGANIKTVALLKKLGVKHIYARAADPIHRSILEGMQIDRILAPEQRAARDLSLEMELGYNAKVMKVDSESYVMSFEAPAYFYGLAYTALDMPKNFDMNLISASRPTRGHNMLGIGTDTLVAIDTSDAKMKVEQGDIFVCYGSRKAFHHLIEHVR